MDYAVIIPARYSSTRFPGKPLVDIAGRAMVLHVADRAAEAVGRDKVYVATDDQRIAAACNNADYQVVMTSSSCLTGTDRVVEAASAIDADIYINVQGDEPMIKPEDITTVLTASQQKPGSIINAMATMTDPNLWHSLTVPKVVARQDGRLLYMSRSPIPISKDGHFVSAHRQVCIYAFPASALQTLRDHGASKTPLEHIEDIEILRFIELGLDVHMVEVSPHSIAVDTPEDLAKVKALFSA